mgnify:CR=1 FL=1
MPIYSFGCSGCGYQQDHLLKMSESVQSCPKCGSLEYKKLLTAASFSMGNIQKTPCGADTREIKDIGCGGSCACHPK